MSSDCFLSMDEVPGEAQDPDFEGTIEVFGWKWGAATRGEFATAGTLKKAVSDIRQFTFEHNIDSATAGLMTRCMTNILIPKATLTQRRAGGSSAQKFLEIAFKQVRIVDVSMVMADDAGKVSTRETVSFSFDSVSMDYTPQSKAGAARSGRHNFTWKALDK